MIFFSIVVSATMALSATATATATATPAPDPQLTPAPTSPFGAFVDGTYMIAQESAVPMQGLWMGNESIDDRTQPRIVLFKGEYVRARALDGERVELSLKLDESEIGEIPDRIEVTSEDFRALHPLFVGQVRWEDAPVVWPAWQEARRSHSDRSISRAGRVSLRRGRASYMGAHGCVAYVLRAVGWPGGVSGNGRDVASSLRRVMGYRTVSCANPPVGAVASWTGGYHGLGHTAYWTGRCWAYDLACADPGKMFRMRECVAR